MAHKNDGASANSKRGEPPSYLSEDQACELLRDALDEYDRALEHHGEGLLFLPDPEADGQQDHARPNAASRCVSSFAMVVF